MSNYTSPTKKGLALMLAFFATWTVAYTALGAGRAVGNSGSFRASSPSRQQMFPHGFHHSRFFGGDGTGEVQVTVSAYASRRTRQATSQQARIHPATLGRRRIWSRSLSTGILDRHGKKVATLARRQLRHSLSQSSGCSIKISCLRVGAFVLEPPS
jgi:hypothetical protein